MSKSAPSKFLITGFVALMFGIGVGQSASAQEGLGEQIGARIDRGLDELGDNLREGWASLRKTVDNFSVQGRVYSRLRWDKQLADAQIAVTVAEGGVVSIRGVVSDDEAKAKAAKLAQNTVGVEKLMNRLTVAEESVIE